MTFVVTTFDRDKDTDDILNFCNEEFKDVAQPSHVNMWDENWGNNQYHTLPYLLFKTTKFLNGNGEFFLVKNGNKIIACGGVYRSEFCTDLSLAGVRTWINRDYRNKQIAREYLLPEGKCWSLKNNFKATALSFNDYNKNIIKTFKRIRLGENSQRDRTPRHMFYSNFNEVEFPVVIQYTKQWVVYEKLDSAWNFDWNKIKFKEN